MKETPKIFVFRRFLRMSEISLVPVWRTNIRTEIETSCPFAPKERLKIFRSLGALKFSTFLVEQLRSARFDGYEIDE